jgi:hypothetical protein
MTNPRSKIESSLAARGRPALWANEQEAAALSGYSPEAFRQDLASLEKAGFPPKNPWNGLRFIPAILHFWNRQVDSAVPPVPKSPTLNIRDYEDDDESLRLSTNN